MKQTEILTHATHVNGWFPAVYMSCMSQNFRLFHVSNLSVRNFRISMLMYTGSLSAAGVLWRLSGDLGPDHGPEWSRAGPERVPSGTPLLPWPDDERVGRGAAMDGRPVYHTRPGHAVTARYQISSWLEVIYRDRARPARVQQ